MEYDFSGYASKSDMKCADGLTIKANAFKHQTGMKVPLVWAHQHNGPDNVLGHAYLENRADGTYTYARFNETEMGQTAKQLVQSGDVDKLSIYAGKLAKKGQDVMHGDILEVSLVLAGANPGAYIDFVSLKHSSDEGDVGDAIIYSDDDDTIIAHSGTVDVDKFKQVEETIDGAEETLSHAEDTTNEGAAVADESTTDRTVPEVYEEMTAEQKDVLHYLVGEAIAGKDEGQTDEEVAHTAIEAYKEGFTMGRNVFDQTNEAKGTTLSHDQISTIVQDGIKMGSFKESFLAHAGDFGIDNIELMFPDAKTVGNTPELLARQAEWVPKVLDATKHAPFAKTKSLTADLTAPEARAKGYVKGTEKVEEVIKLLRRTTGPTTIYKKQKLDRDDILDITDFDVITWLKWEIRFMLNEELARAILIGDGRSSISPDKIKDPEGQVDGTGIRSIANDADLYAVKLDLAANVTSDEVIDEVTRARTQYRGSGTPTFYTTDRVLIDLLLLKDKMGRRLYETEAALAAALRVKEIVAVEVMEETPELLGIIVNLVDYTVGSNRGGELTFFDDFDIDFNQNKYLLETRLSGALTRPKSAIVIRRAQGTLATVTAPSFDGPSNTITVPTATGVDYVIDGVVVTGTVVIEEDTTIEAEAQAGYYLAAGTGRTWTFAYGE